MSLAKSIDAELPKSEQRFRNDLPSNMWFSRFKNRMQLSLRAPENISTARITMSSIEVRDKLFQSYSALVKKLKVSGDEIYNMDETGLQIVTKYLRRLLR
jgi:hypothetical protein